MSRVASLANSGRYADLQALATELVAAHPDSGFAWKALAVSLAMQGKEALEPMERAATLLPNDADCHSNLGSALRQAGRLAEAAVSYQRALSLRPFVAEIWSNLGNVFKELGQLEQAFGAYHKALELKPGFAHAHNNLGNVYQLVGKLEDAAESYERAIALEPSYTDALVNLGIVRRLQNRTASALESSQRALEQNPGLAAAWRLRAELYSDQGDFAAAEDAFRRAIAIEPESPEAWAGIAGLRRMSASDQEWLAATQRIATRSTPAQEVYLRYALGKYFDDVGDYEQAFSHYRRANDLSAAFRSRHDRHAASVGLSAIIRDYDATWLCEAVTGNSSERPVFVVGMPRSGTTLAEQILAAHPQVFGAGELSFWNTAFATLQVSGDGRAVANRDLLEAWATEYLAELRGLCADTARVVDKMPGNFLYLGLIHAALPKARVIHLRRHPIDTCLSIYFQNFGAVHPYANDLEDLAHYYQEYSRLMDHWRSLLPADILLEVPYEGLVQEPEYWSRRMVEFTGLPWDEKCLDFQENRRPVNTFSKWQARQKINTSSVERWRRYESFVGPLRLLATGERTASPIVESLDQAKALHKAGRLVEAAQAYHAILQREPANFEAAHNFGIAAIQTGEAELAITLIAKAVTLQPANAQAHANLGTAYLMADRLDEALLAYDESLKIAPQLAGAWRNRGTILQRLGRHSLAADAFGRCSDLAPGFDFALGSAFEARRYDCNWKDFGASVDAILNDIAAGRNADRPFSFLSVSGSAHQQLLCAKRHAAYLCPQSFSPKWSGERYAHEKIRVAYVSADFRSHVVMNLMAPVLESHDRERFHTSGISLGKEDGSPVVRRAKAALDGYLDASRMTDEQVAVWIREHEVDVAVDLTGYTAGCRPGIFARRPAPVQVGFLGYAGTSGASYMDYLIADAVTIPPELEGHYTERIVRLPHCFLPADEHEPVAEHTPPRQDLGLPPTAFVFCAFGNSYKFNPVVFDVWMRLLRSVPHSVLWLRAAGSDSAMRANLLREASARGVEPHRLVFADKILDMRDHLARHRQADLFLDTLPFGAHATARDALWAGLPVLTCLGEAFAGRVSGSLLRALHLPELITVDLQEYEQRALELAQDSVKLAGLRSRLLANTRSLPVFNTKRYCRDLESAYISLWTRAQRGEQPSSIDVSGFDGTVEKR